MKKILALFLVSLLAACANTGLTGASSEKFDPAWIRQHVATGKTTKQEIESMYGVADSKYTSDGGEETWVYRKNRSTDNILSTLAGYIPGADTAEQAGNMADVRTNKGDYGDTLWFRISKNGIVTSWHN